MDITGEDDGIGRTPRGEKLHQAPARDFVPAPLVHADQLVVACRLINPRHHHLLWQHVPSTRRPVEPIQQPLLLGAPQQRRIRIADARTGRSPPIATGLIGAILSGIEHEERRQVAVFEPSIQLHLRTRRRRRRSERHVLEICLIRLRAATQKQFRGKPFLLGYSGGVVVVDLVVVPGDDEWEARVRLLQVGVKLVEGVPIAIVAEQLDLVARVFSSPSVAPLVFVDVVPKVKHHVEVVLEHVPVGGEIAGLVVLAGGKRHLQLTDRRPGHRKRPGAPHTTGLTARPEAIPIPAVGLQPGDLHMHRVAQIRTRHTGSTLHHPGHTFIGGDRPVHLDRLVPHPPAFQRDGREPGPQHHAVRRGVARRDAQTEGRTGKPGRLSRLSDQRYRRRRHERHSAGQKRPSRKSSALPVRVPDPISHESGPYSAGTTVPNPTRVRLPLLPCSHGSSAVRPV